MGSDRTHTRGSLWKHCQLRRARAHPVHSHNHHDDRQFNAPCAPTGPIHTPSVEFRRGGRESIHDGIRNVHGYTYDAD